MYMCVSLRLLLCGIGCWKKGTANAKKVQSSPEAANWMGVPLGPPACCPAILALLADMLLRTSLRVMKLWQCYILEPHHRVFFHTPFLCWLPQGTS